MPQSSDKFTYNLKKIPKFSFFFTVAAALTCSKCSSQHSMGDCEANSPPENCAEGASVCYEASYAPTKSYSKGCAKSCDNSKLCGANASGDKCKVRASLFSLERFQRRTMYDNHPPPTHLSIHYNARLKVVWSNCKGISFRSKQHVVRPPLSLYNKKPMQRVVRVDYKLW